ncbi:hypothetical protein ACFVHB_29710 [Kitasatospora sp. NPDC127111]|uniref:hypothetical protein n=1 Tax=Kitasatospora sp. NPDC127111 TaxID=3345363 RepID=UPI00362EAB6E
MSGLLDPLDEAQQLLVDTVWDQFAKAETFPAYRYVEYVMRRAGHNAEAVLKSFPNVGITYNSNGYQAAGWFAHRPFEGPVWLTLAGLHHVRGDEAQAICRTLLLFMKAVTAAQEQILQNPFAFDLPALELDLREAVTARSAGMDHGLVRWGAVVAVAEREWPGLRFHAQPDASTGRGRAGHLPTADFDTTEQYLAAVTAALRPPAPSEGLPFSDPRALVRSVNFFDVTCELILGSRMVELLPIDRSSLLVLDVDSEDGLLAGIAALAELLARLAVPGKNPAHALGRITDHLIGELPSMDRTAVERAVHTLDQVRVLRNSSIHTKPGATLLEAYEALGLVYPVRDYAVAWDSIRAHADGAFSRLQEEIQAARLPG